jgi:predicted RNA binding protein YcfA (HicA-like mRNA interferase family)
VKRRDLIRHLEQNGCELLREGGNHSIYVNRKVRRTSSVPRHHEINNDLARKKTLVSTAVQRCPNLTFGRAPDLD